MSNVDGSGQLFIIDTTKVHSVGQQISANATDQIYNVPGSVFDINNQFDNIMPDMPYFVHDAIKAFQQAYHQAYYDLLARRLAIGDLLQDAGTEAEQNEIETAQLFQSNIEPASQTIS